MALGAGATHTCTCTSQDTATQHMKYQEVPRSTARPVATAIRGVSFQPGLCVPGFFYVKWVRSLGILGRAIAISIVIGGNSTHSPAESLFW